jgi:hypothetical protein
MGSRIRAGEKVDEAVFRELSDDELDKPFAETDEDEEPTGNMTTLRSELAAMTSAGFLAEYNG